MNVTRNEKKAIRERQHYYEEHLKILRALGFSCAECGGYQDLEIHHILGTDMGRKRPGYQRIKDWHEQLDRGNLMLLCKSCHDRLHNGDEMRIEIETEQINRHDRDDYERFNEENDYGE